MLYSFKRMINIMPKEKIVLTNEGFAQAMDGEELWINTKK